MVATSRPPSIPSTASQRRNAVGAIPVGTIKKTVFGLAVLGLAAVAAAVASWSLDASTAPPQGDAESLPVQRGDIVLVRTAVGTVNPSESVEVGAQVSGQIRRLHVAVGDLVRAGDLLVAIDATLQISRVEASRAALQSAEAMLRGLEADARLAELLVAKEERLWTDGVGSEVEYETARNELVNAQSSLASLRAAVERDRASLASDEALLGFTRIYAPVAGTVTDVEAREGQTLNATQSVPTILTIANLAAMEVWAEVSETVIAEVRPGTSAWFTTFGGGERRWDARVREVLPVPNVENRVVDYPAVLSVDNADGTLLPGMTAQVFFPTRSARDVLVVPTAALAPDGDGAGRAWVVAGDGGLEERPVRTGLSSRALTEVVAGLAEGERVLAKVP